MAERIPYTSSLGHPGRLAYFPYGATRAEEWGWQTGRNHDGRAPRFEQIGPSQTWYAPTHEAGEAPTGRPWHLAQQQKKWLLKNHPEAALGNDLLGDLLMSELAPQHQNDGRAPRQLTQLAVGEMTDDSMPGKTRGVPLIAMAAGSASDVLRIVRPRLERRALARDPAVALQLYGPDEAQEALWTRDIGVIRRIKAVVDSRRYEPMRWLLVQRDTGTSVFRPKFERVPVVSDVFPGQGARQPSHVNPNLLFAIPTRLTGCDPHADVSFNPGGPKDESRQLAIIDQGGRWTVWWVGGTRARAQPRPRLGLYRCGDIRKGVRTSISQRPSADPQWHRIAWVGAAPGELDDDSDDYEADYAAESHEPRAAHPPLQRSSTLLVCSRRALRLVDLGADVLLPDLPFLAQDPTQSILDVQVDAGDPRYFYVVTTSALFVAMLATTVDAMTGKVAKRASILHSCPHLRNTSSGDLQLSVVPGPRLPKNRTALVHVYSRDSNWVDLFCVTKSKIRPDKVVCHYEKLVLGEGTRPKLQLQTLCSSPVVASVGRKAQPTDSRLYVDQRVRYYQLFYLGADLSLACSLGVSSGQGWDREFLPLPTATDAVAKQKQRGRAIRAMGELFVVPDSLSEFRYRMEALRIATDGRPSAVAPRVVRRPFLDLYKHIRAVSSELLARYSGWDIDMEIHGAAPLDPVYVAAQDALAAQRLPLKTMHELVKTMKLPTDIDEASHDWAAEVRQLGDADPSLQVTSLVKPPRFVDDEPTLGKVYSGLADFIEGKNPCSVELGMAPIVMRQMACGVYLSHVGMMYREPVPAAKPSVSQDPRSSPNLDDSLLDDSLLDDSMLDNSMLEDSILGGSQPVSQISLPVFSAAAREDAPGGPAKGDDCLAIVRALAGTGKTGQGGGPTTWKLGEDPGRHVWSVDSSTEVTQGMRKRARDEAREQTKRRKKDIMDRLRESASQRTPASQPALRVPFGSSQATHNRQGSQAPRKTVQGRFMTSLSQPVAGPHGGESRRPAERPLGWTPPVRTPIDRPNKKRRNGF